MGHCTSEWMSTSICMSRGSSGAPNNYLSPLLSSDHWAEWFELFPLQAFCSSITGALATLAILKGVGVGDSSATPLAAAVTWMLKGNPSPLHARESEGTSGMTWLCFRWHWHAGTNLVCVDGSVRVDSIPCSRN